MTDYGIPPPKAHARHAEDRSEDHRQVRNGPRDRHDLLTIHSTHVSYSTPHRFIEDMTMTRTLRFAPAFAGAAGAGVAGSRRRTHPTHRPRRRHARRSRPSRRPRPNRRRRPANLRILDEGPAADDSVPARSRTSAASTSSRRPRNRVSSSPASSSISTRRSRRRCRTCRTARPRCPNVVNGVNANQLADIGFGFNNSTAQPRI